VVDRPILARKLAAIRDAVARIREVLPDSAETLREDRTAREIVVLNPLHRLAGGDRLGNALAR
jgi:hypothetical protein